MLGEVSKPGIYPDVASHKLYEVISEAGGFTPSASRKIGIIRRNQPQAISIVLPRNLSDDLTGNVDVQPGDTITVPRAPIIYVVGDVGRPSGLLVDNGQLTVLQAIALAGGTNRTAKMGGVRIIRKTPAGMTETRVELKKMLEAKIPDITLQADDILFVPISGARVAAARTFEAAMSAATAVTIYTRASVDRCLSGDRVLGIPLRATFLTDLAAPRCTFPQCGCARNSAGCIPFPFLPVAAAQLTIRLPAD